MSSSTKNETASIPEPRRGPKGGSTYRIRGVPLVWDKDQLQRHLELHEPDTQPIVKSLADEIDGAYRTATVNFLTPPSSEKTVRPCVIAVSGLGGHAYGSFKDKNGSYMWLQDALPSDLTNIQTGRPMARIMIYGHKSTVPGSRSVQDIDDLATTLHSNLLALVEGPRTRPIILMGHSLGGLIVKKTLISLSKSRSQEDQKLFQATYGIVFFGVPHKGMDITSLIPMVGDGPNLPLIKSIGESSPALDQLQEDFHPALGDQGQAEIICFYETVESPTAQQVLRTFILLVIACLYNGVQDRLLGLAQRAVTIQQRI
ncbi:hypothetical protein MKX07_008006 [Trichoderma sp. CBMAI-0711]|nr:hypothetical protein MKX07_008006 [Trichoderma sp. CBMAI-0711]